MQSDFFRALQFLTRLPVPVGSFSSEPGVQGRAVLFYPLVGLLIGLLLCAAYWLLHGAGSLLQAALLLSVWVVISGALHLDGLADLADAWIGGQGDRERTLQIMQDPRSGPMAVTSVVLLLLLKLAALETLLAGQHWAALLLVPVYGRAGLVAALLYIPYVRPNGLGHAMALELPAQQARWVLAVVALTAPLTWGWIGIWLVLLLVLAFYWGRQQLIRRLNGMTGDCAGALCEGLEALALIGLAMLL